MAFTNLVNYIKKVWKDAPSTDTPINAVNLNHMENGISDAATAINQLGQNLTAEDDLRFKFSKSGTKYGYKDANGTFHPFKTAHTGTYNATSRSAALDMGEDHSYRYVNTNNIQTSGTYTATSNGTKDMGATNNYRYVNVNANVNAGRSWYQHDALYRDTVPKNITVPSGMTSAIGAYYMIIVTWINDDNHKATNDKPVLSFNAHTDHKRIGGQIVIWQNDFNAMSCTYIFRSNTANEWQFSLYPNGFDDHQTHFGSLSYEIIYLG